MRRWGVRFSAQHSAPDACDRSSAHEDDSPVLSESTKARGEAVVARPRSAERDDVIGKQLPTELQDADTEETPTGYASHKGCLFPDQHSRSTDLQKRDLDIVEEESIGGGWHVCKISRWGQRRVLATGGVPHDALVKETARRLVPAACGANEQLAQDNEHGLAIAECGSAEPSSDDRARRAHQRNQRRARARAARRAAESDEQEDASRSAVVWLRDDLRLDDNPALSAASSFKSVVCVFIHDCDDPSPWPLCGAAKYWKYESLRHFAASLQEIGGILIFRRGIPAEVLPELCLEIGAEVVLWNRLCEPWYRERDLTTEQVCQLNGLCVRSFKGAALWEPWEARPDERSYTRGFGSVGFYRTAVEELGDVEPPLHPVTRLHPPQPECIQRVRETSVSLKGLGYHFTAGCGFPEDKRDYNEARQGRLARKGKLADENDWAVDMRRFWRFGEKAALARLRDFLDNVLAGGTYEGRERFRADQQWTAVLSPYIRFGELSPRRCYHEAQRYSQRKVQTQKGPRPVNNTFVRRFFWRDLAYWTLWKYPYVPDTSLRPHYETQSWTGTEDQLKRWQRGQTGYPLVDAAMRQLWKIGWMPNYLRHVCAQFLIEYLDISWKKGFEWFDYTLVDSDVAINAYMWQNGGHSGLDQWNFVMHPIYAAKSCDPNGDYVRRWLPELRALPAEYIHCPWEAPSRLLLGANVIFQRTYLERTILDLERARREHAQEVLRVRSEHPDMIAKNGNEWFEVSEGYWVTLITREDVRAGSLEPMQLTRQTPDDPRSAQRRQLQDSISLIMGDFMRQHDRALTEAGGML